MKIKFGLLAVAMMAAGFAFSAVTTNYWVGATSGGILSNTTFATDWVATNGNKATTVTFSNGIVYDLSRLENGATMSVNLADFRPSAVIFAKHAEGDTWTFNSSGNGTFRGLENVTFTVPSGCTLNYGVTFANNWSGTVPKWQTFIGGGTVNMTAAQYSVYGGAISMEDTKLVMTSGFGSSTCDPFLLRLNGDAAEFTIEKSEGKVLGLISTRGCPKVNLNGNILGIYGFYKFIEEICAKGSYSGEFTGGTIEKNVKVFCGCFQTFTQANLAQNLYLVNGHVAFTNDATFSGNIVETVADGRVYFGSPTILSILRGAGIHGGVDIETATTLTVTGGVSASTATFDGMLAGGGQFVKDGAKHTLTLTGPSRHTGGTRVKAGKLIVTSSKIASTPSASAPTADRAIHFDFENAANLVENKGSSGTLHSTVGRITQSDGVIGHGIRIANTSFMAATKDDLNALPDGRSTFTVSLWVRPENIVSGTYPQLMLRGNWGKTYGGLFWLTYDNNEQPGPTHLRTRLISNKDNVQIGDTTKFYDLPSGKTWVDLGWQHIAVVYTNKTMILYRNGVESSRQSGCTDVTTFENTGITIGGGTIYACIDEFIYSGKAWTAAEVKAEYERAASVGALDEGHNAAEDLPIPVAHYAFDDATNPGKDSSTNHYDLVKPDSIYFEKYNGNNESKTVTGFTAVSIKDNIPGSHGKCGFFNTDTSKPSTLVATNFPALVPTGNHSFSISVRFFPTDHGVMGPSQVEWGTLTDSNFVRAMTGNSPCYPRFNYSGDGDSHGGGNNSHSISYQLAFLANDARSWTHVVWTYDGTTRAVRGYLDGSSMVSATKAKNFAIVATNFMVGCSLHSRSWNNSGEKFYSGYIDDIRIYDCALSAAQVQTLTRSMATGKVEPTLPTNGTVTVDSGAAIEFTSGVDHEFSSLTGGGDVFIGTDARVKVNGSGNANLGAISGNGELYLADENVTIANASGFAGTLVVTNGLATISSVSQARVKLLAGGRVSGSELYTPIALAENTVFTTDATGSQLPYVNTTAAVTLPSAAKVVFDATAEAIAASSVKEYPLVTGTFAQPNLSGWSITIPSGHYDARLKAKLNDNGTRTVYVRLRRGGAMLLIK